MENNEETLMIPTNTPEIEYVLIGFTAMDIGFVFGFIACGALIGILDYIKNQNILVPVALVFVFGVFGVAIFQRDRYTENLIDKIKIYIKYLCAQKKYWSGNDSNSEEEQEK